MSFETTIVMIIGIAALVSLRLILAYVGKDFAADHAGTGHPVADEVRTAAGLCRVERGTGRDRHLVYLRPVPTEAVPPTAFDVPVVAPLPRPRAS